MKEKREKRLNSEFKKQIYEFLTSKVKDPLISEMFSITAVETTADLKQAKVYVSVFSGSEQAKEQTFNAIKQKSAYLRRELSREMHIRTVPEFTFLRDESEAYGNKIDKILSGITYSETLKAEAEAEESEKPENENSDK